MHYIQRWRYRGLLLAIMLVLSNVGIGHALDYGIMNPAFRVNNQCRLDFWTTSGLVEPTLGTNHNCVVQLTSFTDLRVSPAQEVSSTLEQGFYLYPQDPSIRFWYRTYYSNMIFQVYDQTGALIHEQNIVAGFDSNEPPALIEQAFPNYAGKYLTVRITARTPDRIPGQRIELKLYVDFEFDTPDGSSTGDGPDPIEGPGGGI